MTLGAGSSSNSGMMGGGFDALASSSVPSLVGGASNNFQQPTWKRSLSELAAANQARVAGMSSSNNGANPFLQPSAVPPSAAAQVLLGSRTDMGALNNLSASASGNAKTSSQTSDAAAATTLFYMEGGIEEAVRRRRDGILARVLQEQHQRTQQLLDQAVDRQLEEDWRVEREWWKKELVGNRNLVGSTNAGLSSLSSSYDARLNGPTGGGMSQSTFFMAGAGGPTVVQNHLEIVCKMIQKNANDSYYKPNLMHLIQAFEKVASSYDAGYATAWKMLGCMLPRMEDENGGGPQMAVAGALGAMVHYCEQYHAIVTNRVNQASLNGLNVSTRPIVYANSMASTVAAFTKLELGSTVAGVWENLYFCIRCGDLNAAKSILDSSPMGQGDFPEQPVLARILGQLSGRQGGASCLFQVDAPMIAASERSLLTDFYQKTANLEPNATFKLKVLALLGGQPFPSPATIEDHLFGVLWVALSDKDPVGKLIDLGSSIRKWGPSHFDGGWGYCLPLIASQQFKTAFSYLQMDETMGLLQSVHLGLSFYVADVQVSDLAQQEVSAPHAMLAGGDTSGYSLYQVSSSHFKDWVAGLLVKYANLLEQDPSAGAAASLQYLLQIRSKEMLKLEVASLIVRAPRELVNQLAGGLDEDGQRQDSDLELYLPNDEVSTILETAATMCKKLASDTCKAQLCAVLYMLAGRYTLVIRFLNEMISPPNEFTEFKESWAAQSQQFYNQYLTKRTIVHDKLEREGKEDLVSSLECLLKLRLFFHQLRQRNYDMGLEMVEGLGLLPTSQEELNEKASKHRDLDRSLQAAYPATIIGAVKCLYEIHRRFKSEAQSTSPTGQARLKELQFRARVLFLFSGLLGMPSECKAEISRMRSSMI